MKYNQEVLASKLKNTLEKFEGMQVDKILDKLKEDINECLSQYISKHEVHNTDFPIEWENDMGKWRIDENGQTHFAPKTIVKQITITLNITKDGTTTN